jgi:hypothetical protein
MKCISCGVEIPLKRLEILPKTKYCVLCSKTERVYGHPIISGKNSYSEIQLVSAELANELAFKQDRKGSVATGVQFRQLPKPKLSNFE